MINCHIDFVKYKRLLGVLYKLGIDTVDTAHKYNDWYLTQKRTL
jgi:hypothetical protein